MGDAVGDGRRAPGDQGPDSAVPAPPDATTPDPERIALSDHVERLCRLAADGPTVDGAGCLLLDAEGALRVAGASSDAARSLAIAEEVCGLGPGHDVVLEPDRTIASATLSPWPRIEELLAGGSIRSVAAVPVVRDHVVIGAFYVSSTRSRPWTEPQLAETTSLAEDIGSAVDDDLEAGPGPLGERVHAWLVNRPLLDEAVTVMARQTGASALQCGRRLRQLAEATQVPAVSVAQQVLQQGRLPHPREFAVDVEGRRKREELARLALSDPLTGLTNRVLLLDRLEHAVWRSERAPGRPAVLYIDLDDFKEVNDRLGHDVGDHVLCTTASRIQASVRPQDTVGRLGGDEFAVVCEAVDGPDVAVEIARRIERAVTEPMTLPAIEQDPAGALARMRTIGVSIGIAVAEPGQAADEVLRAADLAMYRSKAGSERITVAAPRPPSGGPDARN
jgi:diguanylate cyclase (GGDEF)-like protein